jgi:hypothetical protein
MILSSPGRWTRLRAWAFFMLLGFGSAAPSQVLAACGHNAGSHSSRSTLKLLHDLGLEQIADSEHFDSSSERPRNDRPCSGPSCSRGRDLPQAPASSLSSHLRSDDGCCTTALSGFFDAEFTKYQTNPGNPHPQHHSSPVERPPRPCSSGTSCGNLG